MNSTANFEMILAEQNSLAKRNSRFASVKQAVLKTERFPTLPVPIQRLSINLGDVGFCASQQISKSMPLLSVVVNDAIIKLRHEETPRDLEPHRSDPSAAATATAKVMESVLDMTTCGDLLHTRHLVSK